MHRRMLLILVLLMGLVAILATGQESGGQLVVALESEPSTLDMHWSSLNYIRYIASHINEQLFTQDAGFRAVPELAAGFNVSEDGRIYAIQIREGVFFHNGQELVADDVVASLERWLGRGATGHIKNNVVSIAKSGKYEVTITLLEPMGFLPTALAVRRKGAAIYPASVVEAAGTGDKITEYIGTGPYEFTEWVPGSHVLLSRYADYSSRTEEPNGYGGRKTAYLDEIKFVFVTEASVRAVGVQAGDYHFAMPIPNDDYDRIEANPDVISLLSAPRMMWILLNAGEGALTNRKLRQAIQAAVDCEELLIGVFGDQQFWRLDSGIMWQETAWWTDAGASRYNSFDRDFARQLVAESGYAGEPIRMIVSAPEALVLNGSIILEQQLKSIGLNIEAIEYDVATHRQVKKDPSMWEISVSDSTYRTHPSLHIHLNKDWDGGWHNAAKEILVEALLTEQDQDAALAIWRAIENLYYDDVPIVKVGDFYDYIVYRKEVKGFAELPELFFWNVWLED